MDERRRERQRKYSKRWRKKNKEKVKEYNRAYYYEVTKVRQTDEGKDDSERP